ncbi:unnamed protein product [Prorocentrum cordatum]|uniref:Uncharacterized protein n=1 Tax=Prorocentrum cordatum TaxID=2364126 RepID=A0ABN9UJE9_9DINO|nr:unnamed protein product [Polarella glacialis]
MAKTSSASTGPWDRRQGLDHERDTRPPALHGGRAEGHLGQPGAARLAEPGVRRQHGRGEMAEHFRKLGNEAFRLSTGKIASQNALLAYTKEGLEMECKDGTCAGLIAIPLPRDAPHLDIRSIASL